MAREIKGWHVLAGFVFAFSIIVTVNLTLAFNAVKTFPGLEVKNSYVASQSFDDDRTAQEALGWDVAAIVDGSELRLSFDKQGDAVQPVIEKAIFGRATSTAADQVPAFKWDGAAYVAPVEIADGNWNLRVEARAADGTLFKQRIIVEVVK